MSSTTTISCCELACSRHGWEVLDGYYVAAPAFGSGYVTGRVWAVSGRREV